MAKLRALGRILFARPRGVRAIARRTAAGLVLALGVLIGLRLGVGVYLGSDRGKKAVAEDLQSMLGLPVEVADVDLGTRTTAVKFRVLDPAAPTRPELLAVESAAADVSFAEVLARRITPSHIDLCGVSLTIRAAADGTLHSPLPLADIASPGPVPRLAVERGRVTTLRDGLPDFLVTNISIRAESDGDAIRLTGAIDDPAWGKWTITGRVERTTRTGWAEFTSRATPGVEKLRTIPFVPPELWGDSHAAVTVRVVVGADGRAQYSVTVQ